MKALELTNDEIALIQERRKLYDVEKVAALENIQASISRSILEQKKSILHCINSSRKHRLFFKKLVSDLNKEAGAELFALKLSRCSSIKKVQRYYYEDEKGVKYAKSYISNYSDEDKKYGPEVKEWEKSFSYYEVQVVYKEFPSIKICKDNSGRDGNYYRIEGVGYEVSSRAYKRLSTIIERVKEQVHAQRKTLEYRKLRDNVSEEFKVFIETKYRDYVDYFSGVSCILKFENGVVFLIVADIDPTDKTWKAVLKEVRYPQNPMLPEGGLLEYSDLLQIAKDWKPLNID